MCACHFNIGGVERPIHGTALYKAWNADCYRACGSAGADDPRRYCSHLDRIPRRASVGMKMATRRTKAAKPENSSTTLVSVRIVEDAAVNVDSDRITAAVILPVSLVLNVPDV